MREIGYTWSGNNSSALHACTRLEQPHGQHVAHPAARLARVLADQDTMLTLGKMVAQSPPDCMHGFLVQGILPGNTANSVSPEKLPQEHTWYAVLSQLLKARSVAPSVTPMQRDCPYIRGGEETARLEDFRACSGPSLRFGATEKAILCSSF